MRRARFVLFAVATLALAGAELASATEPTKTSVTVPADPVFKLHDLDIGTSIHVEGTSTGGSSPDMVTVKCVPHTGGPPVFGTLAMNATGEFAGDVAVTTDRRSACVIEALPASQPTGDRPGAANPNFIGPRAYLGSKDVIHVSTPASPVTTVNVVTQKTQGSWDLKQTGSCPVNRAALIDPVTFDESDVPLVCNPGLFGSNAGQVTPGTRSQLLVDGVNAYLPAPASDINGTAANYQPPVTQFQYDTTNGDLTLSSTEKAVKCSPDTSFPPDSTKCADFVQTGVQVETVITATGPGTASHVVQKFSSTDGAQHQLDLLWDNETEVNAQNGGHRFPWVDATYKPRAEGDVVAPPPPGPGSAFSKPNVAGADGTLTGVQGVQTWAAAPESVTFIRATNGPGFASDYELGYHRTVTPSAPTWFGWAFNLGTSFPGLEALAHDAENAFKPHVAITGPADGSTTPLPTAAVTGTSSDASGDLVAVTVNGNAAAVAADGSWSVSVPLTLGANTLTATATNRYANTTQATSSVTFAPVFPPSHVFKGARFKGSTTLRLDKRGRVKLKVACPADSQNECTGKGALVSAAPVSPRSGATRAKAKKIKLGSRSFKIKAGKTGPVLVKISRKGRKVIAKRGKLAADLTVTSKDGSGQPKVTRRRLTLRPRKP